MKYRIRRGADQAWLADSRKPYHWTDIADCAVEFSERHWAERLIDDPHYRIEGMDRAVIEEFRP